MDNRANLIPICIGTGSPRQLSGQVGPLLEHLKMKELQKLNFVTLFHFMHLAQFLHTFYEKSMISTSNWAVILIDVW